MNSRKSLTRSILILALTLLGLAAVTLAWFLNSTSPILDRLNASSAALNVDVTITGVNERGEVIEKITQAGPEGNTVMVVENIKPGDTFLYTVSIINRGAACRVYFGLSDIEDFKKEGDSFATETEFPLSEMIKVTLKQEEGEPPEFVEKEIIFLGDRQSGQTTFSFLKGYDVPAGVGIDANPPAIFQYQVEFIGKKSENEYDGELANNHYTSRKMTGKFAVISTLAK